MSATLTETFKKEMIEFITWVELNNYTLHNKSDKSDPLQAEACFGLEVEWTINLLPEYEEPKRNKLLLFLKNILEIYDIIKDSSTINDTEQLIRNFKDRPKETKPRKKRTLPKKESPKKSPKKELKELHEELHELKLDSSIDTVDLGYLSETEFTTKELEHFFNEAPVECTYNPDCRYEWKFWFNGKRYSLYNWAYHDDTFDEYYDNEWFLSGENKNDSKIIKEMISVN